jgi:hypothetical protein
MAGLPRRGTDVRVRQTALSLLTYGSRPWLLTAVCPLRGRGAPLSVAIGGAGRLCLQAGSPPIRGSRNGRSPWDSLPECRHAPVQTLSGLSRHAARPVNRSYVHAPRARAVPATHRRRVPPADRNGIRRSAPRSPASIARSSGWRHPPHSSGRRTPQPSMRSGGAAALLLARCDSGAVWDGRGGRASW